MYEDLDIIHTSELGDPLVPDDIFVSKKYADLADSSQDNKKRKRSPIEIGKKKKKDSKHNKKKKSNVIDSDAVLSNEKREFPRVDTPSSFRKRLDNILDGGTGEKFSKKKPNEKDFDGVGGLMNNGIFRFDKYKNALSSDPAHREDPLNYPIRQDGLLWKKDSEKNKYDNNDTPFGRQFIKDYVFRIENLRKDKRYKFLDMLAGKLGFDNIYSTLDQTQIKFVTSSQQTKIAAMRADIDRRFSTFEKKQGQRIYIERLYKDINDTEKHLRLYINNMKQYILSFKYFEDITLKATILINLNYYLNYVKNQVSYNDNEEYYKNINMKILYLCKRGIKVANLDICDKISKIMSTNTFSETEKHVICESLFYIYLFGTASGISNQIYSIQKLIVYTHDNIISNKSIVVENNNINSILSATNKVTTAKGLNIDGKKNKDQEDAWFNLKNEYYDDIMKHTIHMIDTTKDIWKDIIACVNELRNIINPNDKKSESYKSMVQEKNYLDKLTTPDNNNRWVDDNISFWRTCDRRTLEEIDTNTNPINNIQAFYKNLRTSTKIFNALYMYIYHSAMKGMQSCIDISKIISPYNEKIIGNKWVKEICKSTSTCIKNPPVNVVDGLAFSFGCRWLFFKDITYVYTKVTNLEGTRDSQNHNDSDSGSLDSDELGVNTNMDVDELVKGELEIPRNNAKNILSMPRPQHVSDLWITHEHYKKTDKLLLIDINIDKVLVYTLNERVNIFIDVQSFMAEIDHYMKTNIIDKIFVFQETYDSIIPAHLSGAIKKDVIKEYLSDPLIHFMVVLPIMEEEVKRLEKKLKSLRRQKGDTKKANINIQKDLVDITDTNKLLEDSIDNEMEYVPQIKWSLDPINTGIGIVKSEIVSAIQSAFNKIKIYGPLKEGITIEHFVNNESTHEYFGNLVRDACSETGYFIEKKWNAVGKQQKNLQAMKQHMDEIRPILRRLGWHSNIRRWRR